MFYLVVKTEKVNEIVLIVYLCDEELKDGEIYPMTHGEYFFGRLTVGEQVYAIDEVFGQDGLGEVLTTKMIALLIITAVYLFMNLMACCCSAKKDLFPCCHSS